MGDDTGSVDVSQLTISPEATTLQPNEIKLDETDPEEKKPSKKRKSWGQELPTPKTNLPPRCVSTFWLCERRVADSHDTENEPRPKTKKNNVVLSACFVTVPPLKHPVNENASKSKNWRGRNSLSKNRILFSSSDLRRWRQRITASIAKSLSSLLRYAVPGDLPPNRPLPTIQLLQR